MDPNWFGFLVYPHAIPFENIKCFALFVRKMLFQYCAKKIMKRISKKFSFQKTKLFN